MLGRGGAQHAHALAVEEDDRAQIDVELHIQALGVDLGHRGADPDTGVVDQHVEPAEALLVLGHHPPDRLLVGHVSGDVNHLGTVAKRGRGLPRVSPDGGRPA